MFPAKFMFLAIAWKAIWAGKDLISVLHGHTSTAGLLFEQETTVNWRQCVHRCRNEPLCASFNYGANSSQHCSLFRNKDTYTEHTGDSSVVYGLMVERQGASVCISSPCQNGGQCVEDRAGFICQCDIGFMGSLCEININECASSPCYNGNCVDGVNSYTCTCHSGYYGTRCETRQCPSSPCNSRGTCTDGLGTYTCTCYTGWSGAECTTSYFVRHVTYHMFGGQTQLGAGITGVSLTEQQCVNSCTGTSGCKGYMFYDSYAPNPPPGGMTRKCDLFTAKGNQNYGGPSYVSALLGGNYPP